jgi:hypothetical protein
MHPGIVNPRERTGNYGPSFTLTFSLINVHLISLHTSRTYWMLLCFTLALHTSAPSLTLTLFSVNRIT